jgi:hypothetical protein
VEKPVSKVAFQVHNLHCYIGDEKGVTTGTYYCGPPDYQPEVGLYKLTE